MLNARIDSRRDAIDRIMICNGKRVDAGGTGFGNQVCGDSTPSEQVVCVCMSATTPAINQDLG